MRQISVLLTKYSDWISTILYHVGGKGFTHSSISLEEDRGTFYSFNFRGFAVETIDKHRRRGVKKVDVSNCRFRMKPTIRSRNVSGKLRNIEENINIHD